MSLPESVTSVIDTIFAWLQSHLWGFDVGVQLGYIAFSLLVAGLLYKLVQQRIINLVEKLDWPAHVKRITNNLRRLLLPLAAVFFIAITAQVLAQVTEIDLTLSYLAIKLLLAWIGIRFCLQFVNNLFIRNIAAFSIWAITALSIFGVLDETQNILDAVGFNIGDFRMSALVIVSSGLSLFFLLYLALFASQFLERNVLKSKSLKRSSQVLIAKIIRITLIVIAVIIGLTSAGVDLSIFAVLSGAIGLGIGFGLQKVVSNLFSGLLLLMDQSIQPGDVIELENSGTFGWVNNMAARYTEIVTRDNKSYLIPNEEFITQRVVNWSHGNNLVRLDVDFGVHYNSDPHQVIALAKEAACRPKRVVSTPEPICWMTEFGDSSLNFSLRFWIKDAESGVTNVQGEVLLSLWDIFKENNVEIPYPHREVFVHEVPNK